MFSAPFGSQEPLARILDLAEDAVLFVDREQRIVQFNKSAERIFGHQAGEIIGQPLDILLPDRIAAIHRRHVQDFAESSMAARQMGERSEILGRRKDGSEFPAEASISKADVGGRIMFMAIVRDVSSRKTVQQQLEASLREKEMLLKEVHHRVKNNLQVVSSLLALQSRGDEKARMVLHETQDRVHSMALVHEILYQSGNLSTIDLGNYLRQLAAHLFQSYEVSTARIHLRTDVEKLYVDVDAAVQCGLIISELVSNSLKYAFPGGRQGEIKIEAIQHPDGLVDLTVADNGIGLESEFDWSTAKTLGWRLVQSLSEQLGATIEVKSRGGTEVRLRFAARAGH